MIEFNVQGEGERAQQETLFQFVFFGNFKGSRNPRPQLKAIEVSRASFDNALQELAPQVTVQLELPKVSDMEISLNFKDLKDFTKRGLHRAVPLLQDLKTLHEQVAEANQEHPLQMVSLMQAHPGLARVAEIAQANQASPATETIDLLSMIDIGEEDEEPNQSRIHHLFEAQHYSGSERGPLLAEITDFSQTLLKQLTSNETVRALHGLWRGLRACLSKLPSRVRVALVDCSKDELCDATYSLLVQPEQGEPLTIDLALYCEPLAHLEEDRHIIHHLGRMAESLALPMILETDLRLFGYRNWRQLSHARELGGKLEAASHLKWRQLREQPGSQWLFLAVNPVCLAQRGDDNQEVGHLAAAYVVAALLGQPLSEEGSWPAELMGKTRVVDMGSETAATMSEALSEDLAFAGLCTVGSTSDGEQKLMGITSFAKITMRSGGQQLNAANLVPYSLPYRFYSGCCARYLQQQKGDLESFRHFAAARGEGAMVLEEDEGRRLLRLKPTFTIFGVGPDLVLETPQ